MTIYEVIILVLYAVTLLLILFVFPLIAKKYHDGDTTKISVILCGALVIVCVCGIHLTSDVAKKKFYSEIEAKLKNGYILYIDGNETDPKYIDIENYGMSSYTIRGKTILIATRD